MRKETKELDKNKISEKVLSISLDLVWKIQL